MSRKNHAPDPSAPPRRRLLVALAGLSLASPALGQTDTGQRPLRIIIPLAPGGAVDATLRQTQRALSERLGQPILLENRPGGATVPGTEAIARAAPDGLTIGTVISSHAANPSLLRSLPFDPIADFTPLAFVWRAQGAISVPAASPIMSFTELVATARARPGQIGFATPGIGSAFHIVGEMLRLVTGADFTHIPYRGAGPALNDAVAGQVPMAITNVSSTAPLVRGGRLRALAVSGPARSPLLAEVPTVAESGYPGFDITEWMIMLGPAGLSADVTARLNAAFNAVLTTGDSAARLQEQGLETAAMSPASVRDFMISETAKLRDVISRARIEVQ